MYFTRILDVMPFTSIIFIKYYHSNLNKFLIHLYIYNCFNNTHTHTHIHVRACSRLIYKINILVHKIGICIIIESVEI